MYIYNYESLLKCINKSSVYVKKLYHFLYLIVHRHVSYDTVLNMPLKSNIFRTFFDFVLFNTWV